MSKSKVPQTAPTDNGEAAEPNGQPDTRFAPADLEAGATPASGNPPSQSAPDPFDPANLRLSQDFGAAIGVKKALLSVPARKPDKAWFVRVHPAGEYRLQTAVIELKAERGSETYLVAPILWPTLATEATFRAKLFATAVNRQGTVFLWEVNLPRPDGRADEWSRTALAAVEMATTRWVRTVANLDAGAYDVFEASAELTEPVWPDVPFRELLRVAFKDRFITNADHPILRKLRGEV
jgi:hypothetical protein